MPPDIAADAFFSARIKTFEQRQILVRTDRVGQAKLETTGKNRLPTDVDVFFALCSHFIKVEITTPAAVVEPECDDLAFFRIERIVRGIPDKPGARTRKKSLATNRPESIHGGTIDLVELVIFKPVQHKSRERPRKLLLQTWCEATDVAKVSFFIFLIVAQTERAPCARRQKKGLHKIDSSPDRYR